jgi:hypothetical protein
MHGARKREPAERDRRTDNQWLRLLGAHVCLLHRVVAIFGEVASWVPQQQCTSGRYSLGNWALGWN